MISTIEKKLNKTSFTRIKAIDQNYPLYGNVIFEPVGSLKQLNEIDNTICLLYTSPSPRDKRQSRMPSSA